MVKIEEELKELKLSGMAQCWRSLMETRKLDALPFTDGMQLLVQSEKDHRRRNRDTRLLKNAAFRYDVCMEEVAFDVARGFEKARIMELATCGYLQHGVPVIITGPAGTGKSYLASAFGHQACLMGYKVAYFNMYRLMEKITMARIESTLPKFFDRMMQTDLLILDDFGVKVLERQQLLDFMEIIEDRHGRKSTIIVSQIPVSDWYDVLKSNTTAADAILDRIVHTAQRFELKGESLRKK